MTKTEMENRIAELENELAYERKMATIYQRNCIIAQRPRFLLARFEGTMGSGRRLFDAHVIEVGTDNSFPLSPGYQGVEVYVTEVKR